MSENYVAYTAALAPPSVGEFGSRFWGVVLAINASAVAEGAQQCARLRAVRDDCPADARGAIGTDMGLRYEPVTANGGAIEPKWQITGAFNRWADVVFGRPSAGGHYPDGIRGFVSALVWDRCKVFVSDAYSVIPNADGVEQHTLTAPDTTQEEWSAYRLVLEGETDIYDGIDETECVEDAFCLDTTLCGHSWTDAAAQRKFERIRDTIKEHMPAHYHMTAVIITAISGFGDDVTCSNALNATGSGGTVSVSIGGGFGWRLI